ncbi:hypothetical protein OZ410_11025 [Robiginitalea sp. M366]|uniref:hypothetical protein n=1 Tax=Robiginitalea aestuariiviva TaxID=3036903 RepID=UPI00240DB926|nr:hypothetical protein [Robiginitalea aestuariiviva]MDG1572848.1 hypothetical protein [Robiginitalea aestuariiviva]
MTRTLLVLFTTGILLPTGNGVFAQRRSDLLAQIDTLNRKITEMQAEINTAQQKEKASRAEAEAYETQVSELKDANATLLKNLGSFAQVSNKNTEALNQALSSLEARESELRQIMETLSRNDSSLIALLTDAKKTLGPDAQLKAAGGSLVISASLEQLFGSDTGTALTETSNPLLAGVATLAAAHPQLGITVEGLSMTGDLATATQQAASVLSALRDQHGVPVVRMGARGRDGNFSEGVDILLHPDYRAFYREVKSEIKQ